MVRAYVVKDLEDNFVRPPQSFQTRPPKRPAVERRYAGTTVHCPSIHNFVLTVTKYALMS